MKIKEAEAITHTLSKPGKMPGFAYSTPAHECKTGTKLRAVAGSVCANCYAFERGRYRFKNVIENYGQTVFVEEALHRLVEVNYRLGLIEESQKYANLLGYNYNSSEWYERSYSIFDKMYEINKNDDNQDKDKFTISILKKFKSLFNWDEKKRN